MLGRLGSVSSFDMHTKTLDGVTRQSLLGAILTVAAVVITLTLFVGEMRGYGTPEVVSRMKADRSIGARNEMVKLHFNFDFMEVPCDKITFKQEIVRGTLHEHIDHDDVKDIHKDDKMFRAPFGVDGDMTKGCWVHGSMSTDKIAGNMLFKVEPLKLTPKEEFRRDKERENDPNFMPGGPLVPSLPPLNHRINHVAFLPTSGIGSNLDDALYYKHGDNEEKQNSVRHILKSKGLEGEVALMNQDVHVEKTTGLYHYEIEVVPTHYHSAQGEEHNQVLNQYSVVERPLSVTNLAYSGSVSLNGHVFSDTYGVVLTYDFYPLILAMEEHHEYFVDFLAGLFGIIGGIITIAGLAERCLAQSSKSLMGKKD